MRQYVDGASYDPAALKVMRKAFNDAWMSLEPNLPDDPREIARARVALAEAVFTLAERCRDAEPLKNLALLKMALSAETANRGTELLR